MQTIEELKTTMALLTDEVEQYKEALEDICKILNKLGHVHNRK